MAKWGEEIPGTEYYTTGDPENAIGTVLVNAKELLKLREDQRFLQALMDAGVDNWEGYGEACASTADIEDPEL